MDELNNYAIKGFNFIIWFFRLLLLLMVTIILLLFVLKINETVSIKEGEIIASSPQTDYKAPYEAQLINIIVKEGQKVKKGDTLVIIQSETYNSQLLKINAEITDLQNRIKSIGALIETQRRRKEALAQAGKINSMKYKMDIIRMSNELKALDEQYAIQKQRWSSADERYKADSVLYQKDMLSKVEYNNTKDAYLILRENIVNLISQRERQMVEKDLGHINYNKEQNDLSLSQVQVAENDQAMLQAKSEMEAKLIQDKESLKEIQKQLNRQYITAVDGGIVNFIFNTRQTSNMINKGDLLISVAPREVSYYAKAIIPQKEARYIRVGLDARLKLDAYYQFEQGVIRGSVSYMAERKEKDQFYALIQLAGANHFQLRSGYSFSGEIIIARMSLIKYFIKKLFKKLDNQ